MNLLCKLGFHKWEWLPQKRDTGFGTCFYYRRCVRPNCNTIEEVFIGAHDIMTEKIQSFDTTAREESG